LRPRNRNGFVRKRRRVTGFANDHGAHGARPGE
jgi:hypothetical protein